MPSYDRSAADQALALDTSHATPIPGRDLTGPIRESNGVLLTIVKPPVVEPPSPHPIEQPPPPPPPVINPVVERKRRRPTTVRPAGRRVFQDSWGSDVAVSKPEAPSRPILRDMGGFGFTSGGIAHNITEEQVEEIFSPTFTPPPTRED
jgi:hypothetical protein